MKRIGLLGGMSWESSIEYERIINTEVRDRLGGVHSADLVMRSYDFAVIEELQARGDWQGAGRLLADDAALLERAGAEVLVLCTNTMHAVADVIESAVTIPFLHIADTTAAAVLHAGLDRVALLGTRYTMELPFYRDVLAGHGIAVDVPSAPDRESLQRIIYDELVRGVVTDESRDRYLAIVTAMTRAGAGGVVSGCTELELLAPPEVIPVPSFPTTRLHALAAVDAALA